MNKIKNLPQKSINKIKYLKKSGKKIVLCHGAFDLVHPGHINHFVKAKKLGDVLIVSITGDKYIKKNANSPFFSENTRLNFLKKINIIDYVAVVYDNSAIPSLKTFKPDFYCKGLEYKKRYNIGNLKNEKKIIRKFNGKIQFLGNSVQSSTRLIIKYFLKTFIKEVKKLKKINNKDLEQISKKLRKI